MTKIAEPPNTTGIRLRALVVEPDESVRLKVSGQLQRLGCDVHACGDFGNGTSLYDHHDIIVTMVNGDAAGLHGFVERVRTTSGDAQPYILGLVSGSTVTTPGQPGDAGMNDLLPWPTDAERLSTRLSAIVKTCAEQPRRGLATAPHDGWASPATQVLLEQLPSAVAILDNQMLYLAANQRWRREFQLLGMPVLGQSHYELFPDLHHGWRDLYSRCLTGHRERMDDEVIVRPDGKTEWMRWDVQPWRDDSTGTVGGIILSATILTEDTRDKATLAFEQNLACSLLHSPLAPVVLVDSAGRIQRANETARKLAGEQAIHDGQTFFWNALTTPARREAGRQRVQELLKLAVSGRNVTWPASGGRMLALPPGEGRSTGIAWSVFPNRRADGVFEGLIFLGFPPAGKSPTAMIEEATPPAPAAAAAAAAADELGSEDYRRIAEAAPFGMIVLNEEAEVLYANPQHRTVLGFSIAECGGIGGWLERACAADDEFKKRAMDEWWERVWRRRAAWTCSMRTAGGMLKEVEFRPSPLPDHRLLLTIFDVTDAQLEEQALRASEARYRGLFQNCAAGVAVLNSSGNITETNAALEQLTGFSRTELRRSNLSAFLPEEDVARIRQAAAAGDSSTGEMPTRVKTKGGEEVAAGFSWSVVKNEAGVTVYTACLLHPLAPAPAAASAPAPAGWQGSDWSLTIPDWVVLINEEGRILEHSDARDFAGIVPRDGLTGRTLEECVPAIADLLPVDVMIERLRENPGAETRCEFSTVLTAGGKPRFIEARMLSLAVPGSDGLYGLVVRDLTSAASRSQQTGGVLPWLKNVSTPVILTNERGRITGMNPAAENLLGWTAIALEGSGLFRIFRPDEPRAFSDEISAELTRNRCWKSRTVFHRQNGTKEECDVELVPAHDEASGSRGFVTTIRLVHKSETAAGVAAAAITNEPSVTLHRARNDLQILSSLLTLQAERTGDPAAKAALHAGKDRLNAVALVYRLISNSEDTVDFTRYASDLGGLLLDTRKVADRIKIEVTGEPARLSQKTAITLGIILEELVSAAIAESFPGGSSGTIRISLTTGGGEGVLIVRDNGTLLTDSLRERRLGSFSWQVVQTLAEPVGGVVTLLSDLENQVRMRFRLAPIS